MSSPGRKAFSFVMWIAMIPFAIFSLLILFVTTVASIGS